MLRGIVVAVVAALAAMACSGTAQSSGSSRVLNVVAGENFWGSVTTQLGGSHVKLQSVLTDPNADPHEYESNANDARAFAQADLVILNGAGYDDWGQKLLDANKSSRRTVLTVADVLGKKAGDNPHFWYDPTMVGTVADRITATLKSADSADSPYFDQQRSAFDTALKPYRDRIAEIKQKFAGVKVGATENIFFYLASALGLNLISPPEFMKAIAESSDPPANTVVEFQNQIQQKQIKVLVYNVQTATDVTTNLRHSAAALDIPVVGVSETLQPESATFQDWQLSQLLALENALNADALVR
jgi:zinc/manganese transport system substrate-binding protein